MSVANAIQEGDFDLNLVSLRKPLLFRDNTIQTTAYTGSGGVPTLAEVLTAGDNGGGLEINDISFLLVESDNVAPNATVIVRDSVSGKIFSILPESNAGSYNPLTENGNQALVGQGSAVNTSTLTLVPWSNTTCGIKISGAGTASATIGAGGALADASNRCVYKATGTEEYGEHRFVNSVARYDAFGGVNAVIPCSTTTSALVAPNFEFQTVQLLGNAGTVSAVITLASNINATTNYTVMPSIYYGFTGSGGTYNAVETSAAVGQIVISGITSTQFTYNITKATVNNVNIYLQFLICYNLSGTNYPKTYS
jgi:hypothetical protein